MQKKVWKDIADFQIKRLNHKTKSQRPAWIVINSKKKKMDQLENGPQFAHILI